MFTKNISLKTRIMLQKAVSVLLITFLFFMCSPLQIVHAASYIDEFSSAPFLGTPSSFVTGTASIGLSYVCSNCDFGYSSSDKWVDSISGSAGSFASITITARSGGKFAFSSIYIDTVEDLEISGTGDEPFTKSISGGSSGTYSPDGGDKIVDQVVIANVSPGYVDFDIKFDSVTVNFGTSLDSFERQTPASSPTNADTLVFRATFSDGVQNVSKEDFSVNGTTTATVTGVSSVSTSVYDITVSGGDLANFNGVVGIDLKSGHNITDSSTGLPVPTAEPATDETYTLDNTGPTVTINQAGGQSDPATGAPINFTVVFSDSVSDFATGDVTLTGTAGATTATVTGSGTNYNVAVSGMTNDGTVIATINSGVASDALGNLNSASTSTDNVVTFDGEPEIDIQRPAGTSIADGGSDILGNRPVGTVNLTYTVSNSTGKDQLTINNVTAVNLSNAASFSLNTSTPINIPAGGSGSFDISFNVVGAGAFSLDMDVANNDQDESNYDIAISGTGYIEPEMEVSFNSTVISDGDNTPSSADGTDFGDDLANYSSYSPRHTFTINNTGAGTLLLTNSPRVSVTGADFSLITDAPVSIAPGGSGTFTVQFAATATGARNATISIESNDTDENPYNFSITGTGYAGSLMVVQGGSPQQDIENGDTTPSQTDDTEFGVAAVSGGSVAHTFEIENFGSDDLTLAGSPVVQITGAHAADFSVTTQPSSPITSGSNDTFTITFDPSAAGNRTATVSIQNNDPNRNPYTFSIQGQGDEFDVMMGGNTSPTDGEVIYTAPDSIQVQFMREALADGSASAANFINNYLLVEDGINGTFNTLSCAGGLVSDDTQITISSVSYNSLANTATLTVNSGDFVQNGHYRLFICGTTSIYDIYGNELNGGVSDTTVSFTLSAMSGGGGASASTAVSLPATGFAMGSVSPLALQPAEKSYSNNGMVLEIPALGVDLSIVGVPLIDGAWDVSWLSDEAGYLYGTAYPTWKGNTLITGHVWTAANQPGPFSQLKNLHYGDLVKIHSGNSTYIYEVHDTRLHKTNNVSLVASHEELDWLTLITCEEYQETDQSYAFRRIVRAVLIEVINQ